MAEGRAGIKSLNSLSTAKIVKNIKNGRWHTGVNRLPQFTQGHTEGDDTSHRVAVGFGVGGHKHSTGVHDHGRRFGDLEVGLIFTHDARLVRSVHSRR